MKHEEFMEALCLIVDSFCSKLHHEQHPCICGENELSKLEVKDGTWRGDKMLLKEMCERLGVEEPPCLKE